jgi:hypothetical protein
LKSIIHCSLLIHPFIFYAVGSFRCLSQLVQSNCCNFDIHFKSRDEYAVFSFILDSLDSNELRIVQVQSREKNQELHLLRASILLFIKYAEDIMNSSKTLTHSGNKYSQIILLLLISSKTESAQGTRILPKLQARIV